MCVGRAFTGEVPLLELRHALVKRVLVEVRGRPDPARAVDLEELEERDFEALVRQEHQPAQNEALAAHRDVGAVESVEQIERESQRLPEVDGTHRWRRHSGAPVDGDHVVRVQGGSLVVSALGNEPLVSGQHPARAVLRSRVTGIDRGAAQLVEAGEGGGEVILVEELLSFDPQIGVEDRDEVELPLVAGAVGAAPDALGAHQRRAATEVHGPVEEPLP